MAVNLHGMFNVTHAFLEQLRATRGRIINIGSIQSFVHVRTPNSAAYTASKHGVLGFTRALAAELGKDGVRVNAIGPGLIETPLTKKRAPAIPSSSRSLWTIRRLAALERPKTSSGRRSSLPLIFQRTSPVRSSWLMAVTDRFDAPQQLAVRKPCGGNPSIIAWAGDGPLIPQRRSSLARADALSPQTEVGLSRGCSALANRPFGDNVLLEMPHWGRKSDGRNCAANARTCGSSLQRRCRQRKVFTEAAVASDQLRPSCICSYFPNLGSLF
jgi:short chain dehydrogenase